LFLSKTCRPGCPRQILSTECVDKAVDNFVDFRF